MSMLVSPCKNCDGTNRKLCSQKCKKLEEYRKGLGNPLEFSLRPLCPFEVVSTGNRWRRPVWGWLLEEGHY